MESKIEIAGMQKIDGQKMRFPNHFPPPCARGAFPLLMPRAYFINLFERTQI